MSVHDDSYTKEREDKAQAAVEKATAAKARLKEQYADIKKSPALADILRMIDGEFESSFMSAGESVDNPARAAAYGQRSYMCDIIRAYIRDKLS